MRALRHGVPIVAIPGFAGDIRLMSPPRRAIRRLLAGPSYAARAKESAAWPASDGAANAAVEPERLLSNREGAPRGRLRPRRNPAQIPSTTAGPAARRTQNWPEPRGLAARQQL